MATFESLENQVLRTLYGVDKALMTAAEKAAVEAGLASGAAAPASALGAPPKPPVPGQAITPPVWPLQADCDAFYGCPGSILSEWVAWEAQHLVDIDCPWVLNDGGIIVKQIRIHRLCALSLQRVLNNVWDATGKSQSAIETLRYNLYSGSYNQRPIRGGTRRSMHGYGAAIDWDDQENMQHAMTHLFTDQSLLIVKFKEEGWIWGGDWSPQSIDAMHVQAARVYQ